MPTKFYNYAKLNICLQGKGVIFELLNKEFKYNEVSKTLDIDLQIYALDKKDKIDFESKYYSGLISFDNESFYKKDNLFDYYIKNLFSNNKCILYIKLVNNNTYNIIKNLIKSILFFQKDSLVQLKDSIMSYSLFWFLLHFILLKKQMAFLHSSIIEKNGEGTIFAGTGGCGKTSIAFKLIESSGYNYLNEDFGIIDFNSNAYYNPKDVSIYLSDIKFGNKFLIQTEKEMNILSKIGWNLKKIMSSNPRIIINPLLVLGNNKLSKRAKIKRIFYLRRYDETKVKIHQITTEEMVIRCLYASSRELKNIYEIFNQIHSLSYKDSYFLSPSQIWDNTKRIYENCFSNISKYIVDIPRDYTPYQIFPILNKYL